MNLTRIDRVRGNMIVMRGILAILLTVLASSAVAQPGAPECRLALHAGDNGRTFQAQVARLRDALPIERERLLLGAAAQRVADVDVSIATGVALEPGLMPADRLRILWVSNEDTVWRIYGRAHCFVAWFVGEDRSTRRILQVLGLNLPS